MSVRERVPPAPAPGSCNSTSSPNATTSLNPSRRSQQRAFPAPPPPASYRSKHPQPSLWLPSTHWWHKSPRHPLATRPRALAFRSRRRRPLVRIFAPKLLAVRSRRRLSRTSQAAQLRQQSPLTLQALLPMVRPASPARCILAPKSRAGTFILCRSGAAPTPLTHSQVSASALGAWRLGNSTSALGT